MNNPSIVSARGLSALRPAASRQAGKLKIAIRRRFALWIFALLCFGGTACFGEVPSEIAGHWVCAMPMPDGSQLQIGLNLVEEAGTLNATMDIPAQFAMDIPGEKAVFEKRHLHVEFPSIATAFDGEMIDSETLRGGLKRDGTGEDFDWKRSETALKGPARPQEPKRPFPYLEKEVQIENQEAGIRLAGTLTMPRSGGNFPAVVLITSTGPNDRDETIWGHRVFLVLSDWLTRQGIAVLRADDRGVGKSTGDYSKAGLDEFASDALAAVRFLKEQKEIDSKRIGLLGHSEGAMTAPVAATRSTDVSFIVLMAAPIDSSSLDYQYRKLFESYGASEAAIAKYLGHQQRCYQVLKEEKEFAVAERKFQESVDQLVKELSLEESQQLRFDPQQELSGCVAAFSSPEFRSMFTYDAQAVLQAVKCPVLALFGSKDLQVDPAGSMAAGREVFAKSKNQHATAQCLEGLNHLFQTAATPNDTHYEKIEETMSPLALRTISDWILNESQPGPAQ